jgi:hypothetical protein
MSFQRLAYTTELTDEEWQILAPPAARTVWRATPHIPEAGGAQWHPVWATRWLGLAFQAA